MKEPPKLEVIRVFEDERATLGVLKVDGKPVAKTLELPWKLNHRRVSRIPHGFYLARRRPASPAKTGGLGYSFELRGVLNRDAILMHVGNTTKDTEGCIIIGSEWGMLGGEPAVLSSIEAYENLMDALHGFENVIIEVHNRFV